MEITPQHVLTFLLLAIASGRVAYSLVNDEIFRPLREWIWLRHAPESEMIYEYGADGDRSTPARAWHRQPSGPVANIGHVDERYAYDPDLPLRTPTFLGKLIGCPYCMSFWTSAAAMLAWWALGDNVIYPAAPLALWAAANTYAVKGL